MGPEAFETLARTWGVRHNRTVVVYDDDASRHAARAWWVLRHYGHADVRVLDGGIDAWLQQGRPLIFETAQLEVGDFSARENDADLCTLDQLKSHAANGDAGGMQIWDTRSEEEWRGTVDRGNARAGHVPGALNLEWLRLTTGPRGRFQPLDQVRSMLEDAGIDASVPTVTYCQGGIRAAFAAFVLAMLGNESARNYDGSMKEWANREDTPLVLP
jgi:thiosulfate/3-mercaptopyruvate sulfurtransferase